MYFDKLETFSNEENNLQSIRQKLTNTGSSVRILLQSIIIQKHTLAFMYANKIYCSKYINTPSEARPLSQNDKQSLTRKKKKTKQK